MIYNSLNLNNNGWFCNNGPEIDVAVTSRISLSRNIEHINFPAKMSNIDIEKTSVIITEISQQIKDSKLYNLDRLKLSDKLLLSERFYIKPGTGFKSGNFILISSDEQASVIFNDKDHIRIKCIKPGLDLRNAFNACNLIDNCFEEKISYSFSPDFGYMTSELVCSGTGMNASIMLFLPALAKTGNIDKIFREILKKGFSVKGFVGEKEDVSAGDMYIINNQFSIGKSEDEIIAELEKIYMFTADNERNARYLLFKQDKISMEDEIKRAEGILSYCRKISLNEASRLLSLVKLGKYYDLVDKNITYVKLNCLLIQIQKAHLKKSSSNRDEDVSRSELIKNKLFTREE